MSLWDILLVLCLIGFTKYGEYVTDECPQAGYACPKICDVDHKHLPREECNGKAEAEEEDYKKSLQESNQAENSEVLIRGYKDAKEKQESRPDSTSVQPVK